MEQSPGDPSREPSPRRGYPGYADALRHALRIPVLDAITLVDFVHSASTDNPAFGVDFQKSSKVFV